MTVSGYRTSKRASFVGSLAVAIGLALAGGTGVAHADGPVDNDTAGSVAPAHDSRPDAGTPAPTADSTPRTTTSSPAASAASETLKPARSRTESRRSRTALDESTETPAGRTEPDSATAAATAAEDPVATAPSPSDAVSTAYGEIGKWMLTWNERIANWGGKKHDGKTLLESVNVIIVDPNSTTRTQAVRQLNKAMYRAGFPAQPFHSNAFLGSIDDVIYGQQPRGPLQSYSNDLFLLPNDHGRIFGPDPLETSSGYVWSGAFSTERFGFSRGVPGHFYVSSNEARADLVAAMIASGQATYGGLVPMENAYNTPNTTTGDHDGFAVVLVLTGNAPLLRREAAIGNPTRLISAGSRQEPACVAVSGARPALTSAGGSAGALPGCATTRLRLLDT